MFFLNPSKVLAQYDIVKVHQLLFSILLLFDSRFSEIFYDASSDSFYPLNLWINFNL